MLPSMGIFLLLAFMPGYAYEIISVNTVDRPESKQVSSKLFTEKNPIPVIIGIIMKERMNEATNTIRDMKNIKAT